MAEKPLVLIVEDQFMLRFDLADLMEEAGLRAIEAGTADDALAMLDHEGDVSAVITDIDMPGCMNGLALSWLIKGRLPNCPIVIVSGALTPEEKEVPPGAIFLPKPATPRALLAALASLGVGGGEAMARAGSTNGLGRPS